MDNDWYNSYDPSGYMRDGSFPFVEMGVTRSGHKSLSTYADLEHVAKEYSPIAALILKMAAMTVTGKFEIVNRTTRNYTQGQYKEWDKLFLQPNPFQTRTEFFAQLEAYVLLNGYCYVMPIYPYGFNDVPFAVYIIPPKFLKVSAKAYQNNTLYITDPTELRELHFCYQGMTRKLDEKKLLLFKDIGSPFRCDRTQLPKSRLCNLKYPIANGIGTMESMNTLIEDRGANGIIANTASDIHGALPMFDDDKKDILKAYKRTYGLTKEKMSSIIVTTAAVKYQPMSFNVQQLMLHEQHSSCTRDICAMYGFPYRLLTIGEGATYNNQNEDKKSAYQDCIIPNSDARMEQWNNGLGAIDKNIEIIQSYDHLPVMQQTEFERGRGLIALNNAMKIRWENGNLTRNQWLKAIGEDTVEKPAERKAVFDKYKWECTPEELGIIEYEPATGANGNQRVDENASGNQ